MVNWSELPPEILHLISLQIDNTFSLIHFRSVCSSWRSFSILKFQQKRSFKCPLPLNPYGHEDNCRILNSRVYLIKSLDTDFSKYWLFKQQEKENGQLIRSKLLSRLNVPKYGYLYQRFPIDLLNCHIFELAQEYVARYQKWDGPFDWEVEDCIGIVGLDEKNNKSTIIGKLSSRNLSIYRLDDERWTELDMKFDSYFEGIASFKGKFYAIDRDGRTIVVEPNLEVKRFQLSRLRIKTHTHKRWLVMSGDKLLLVEMCHEDKYDFRFPKETWFEVSKLDEKRNDWDPVQVKDVLDGQVLFLDRYSSFLCLATLIPEFRANSIILLNDWRPYGLSENRILAFEYKGQGLVYLRYAESRLDLMYN